MLSPGHETRSAARATHSLATHGSSSRGWPSVATGEKLLLDLFVLFLTDPFSLLHLSPFVNLLSLFLACSFFSIKHYGTHSAMMHSEMCDGRNDFAKNMRCCPSRPTGDVRLREPLPRWSSRLFSREGPQTRGRTKRTEVDLTGKTDWGAEIRSDTFPFLSFLHRLFLFRSARYCFRSDFVVEEATRPRRGPTTPYRRSVASERPSAPTR